MDMMNKEGTVMTCDHGFIGACAECDGCGQQPEREDCHPADISEAAAALGRAGRGTSKRRGDSDHYRALVAKRKDRTTVRLSLNCQPSSKDASDQDEQEPPKTQ